MSRSRPSTAFTPLNDRTRASVVMAGARSLPWSVAGRRDSVAAVIVMFILAILRLEPGHLMTGLDEVLEDADDAGEQNSSPTPFSSSPAVIRLLARRRTAGWAPRRTAAPGH